MKKTRPYQKQAIDGLRAGFAKGYKSQVLCMPTGSGKSFVFTTIANSALSKGKKVLIVCNRIELINQVQDYLKDLGLNFTIIAPGQKQGVKTCFVASIDTLRRRELPDVDLIVIDECHFSTFDKLIDRYKESEFNPLIIGITATPLRTGAQRSLHELYQNIIEPTTIGALLFEGYLVPCRTYAAKIDLSDTKLTGGDYDNKALYKEFNKQRLYEGLIENYEKFAKGKKTLIFNVNVAHSLKTVEALKAAGYDARHLDGQTPTKERRELLEGFKNGEFNILSNCSVLTTGYDNSSIECIIVNRATKSLPLYLQMVGRGSKLDFIVIDLGGNCYEMGLWSDARTWELVKKRRNSSGVAPVKLCESCEAMNPVSARVCKECAEPFKIKAKALLKAEFAEVKGNRGGGERFIAKGKTRAQLHEHAKAMGYAAGWAHVQYKLNGGK
jgi:superfamily II DNA or RNA helicase